LKQLRTNWRKLQARYLYEPLAGIILIFITNAKTDREFNIGYMLGDMLDTYCISKNIYLFGVVYE
jgi:hypothetical protein